MERRTRTANERGLYPGRDRLPLWIPAPNYYLLVFLSCAAVFLIVLAALHDGYDETPWIIAGISAASMAASLFLFREIVLRRVRRRALAARRLSHHLRSVAPGRRDESESRKITLQRNQEILHEIRTKSDAAKVLGKFAEAHREIFDLCERYLTTAASEIASARPGSPRIPALRKGSKFAAARHRFHMLKWAEIKAHSFTSEAGGQGTLADKLEAAREALGAVDRAMGVYPDEPALVDSHAVLQVYMVSARIRESIGKAERAELSGDKKRAVGHYREALADLETSGVDFAEREMMFERLHSEIGRIIKLADV